MRVSSGFTRRFGIVAALFPLLIALTLPLPAQAGTEIGAIPGSFSVNPAGAATYSISIGTPPGIAGIAPHLALGYSSQGGNGLAGYGWDLSGLSAISVCNKSWAQDGVNQSVSFAGTSSSANDFCLDGSKLFGVSGTYGTDGSTYRKELDDFSLITGNANGGAGPVPTTGPQWFKVQTKDGLTFEYGKTIDSEIVAVGPNVPSGVTVVRTWALDAIYDKFGNAVYFTYQQDTVNGDYYPIQISYTNHNATPSTPNGPNTIVLKYEDLKSISPALVWTSYVAGALASRTKRLNEIDVDYNGTPTFTYSLIYDNTLTDANNHTGTERSRLRSVKECAGTTCYPLTTINWQNGQSGWQSPQAAASMGSVLIPTSAQAASMQLIDVNGDGKADIVIPGSTTNGNWWVMTASGNGFNAPIDSGIAAGPYYSEAIAIDISGTGNQGLLVPMTNSNNVLDWFVLVPQITSGTNAFTGFVATDTGQPATGAGGNATVVDMNGDGLQDVLFSDGTNMNWYENAGGTNPANNLRGSTAVVAGAFSFSSTGMYQRQTQFSTFAPDFDGTGRGGFMSLSEKTFNGDRCTYDYCPSPSAATPKWSIEEGAGYNVPPTAVGSFSGVQGNLVVPYFADFNGDGLTDVLYAGATASYNWDVYQSTGAGLGGGDVGIGWDQYFGSTDTTVVNYAGNGRQQVMFTTYNSGGTCVTDWVMVGYAGGSLQSDRDSGVPSPQCANSYATGSLRTGDVRGLGLSDLVWVQMGANGGTVYYALHNTTYDTSNNPLYPDLVSQISDGFSETYNIAYSSIANGTSYTKGITASPTTSFPAEPSGASTPASIPETRNFQGSIYVVQSYSANDGVGGTFTDSFTYSGALVDVLGRGFLGFSETMKGDGRAHAPADTNGTFTDTTYNQFFPLTGTPATATSWSNSAAKNQGNIKEYVQDTYASKSTAGGAQYVYLQTATSTDYEIGAGSTISASSYRTISSTTTPTLDGNAVLSKLDVSVSLSPGGITSDTVTTYNPDETFNWCLVLPASVAVTRTNSNGSLSRTVTYNNDTVHCRENYETSTETISGETLTTAHTYDGYGHLATTSVTGVTGSNSSTRTTTYCYDSPIATSNCPNTVANGTNEFVASIANPLNEIAKQTWNPALGNVATATDPNNVTTSFGYDAFGLKTSEFEGDGTSVTLCYGLNNGDCSVSTAGLPSHAAYWVTTTHKSSTNAAGASSTSIYDSFGRPLQVNRTLLGGTADYAQTGYDNLGRKTATSTPYETGPTTWTYTTYDSFDRPLTVYSPAGQGSGCSVSYQGETTCQASYGYSGLTSTFTDPKGIQTQTVADALGEPVTVTNAYTTVDQAATSYIYDAFGDLHQTTDAAQHNTTVIYDSWGRKTQMIDPTMGTWNYGYNAFGELTSQTDAKSQTISMTYDALGRIQTRTVPGVSGNDTWTYDGPNGTPTAPFIGKLYSLASADGNYSRAYQYDSAGRPSEVDATIAGTTYATNTAYDTFGRVASVTYPAGPSPLADDPPVANAGSNQTSVVGQTVSLDGSASYDPDHGPQPLTYSWVETSGPTSTITLSGANTAKPGFSSNTAGTYVFTLTVSDSVIANSASVSVTLNPQAITNLTASSVNPNTGGFSLSWTNPLGYGNNYLQQSTNGGAFSLLPGAYANPAPLSGFADGSYQFMVQTCANGACDAWTSPVSVSVLRTPSVPAAPSTSPNPATNSNVFSVNWTKPAGTVTYYMVYTSINGGAYDGGTNVGIPSPSTPNNQSWATSQNVNGTYSYEVAACNTVNNAPDCSTPSNAGTETVSLPVPTVSIGASPSSITAGQSSTLSWTWTGNVAATYYMLGNTNEGSTTTVTVTPSFTKTYSVKGCNQHGCGPVSQATVTVSQNGCGKFGCAAVSPAPTASNGSVTTTAGKAVSGSLSAAGSGTLSFAIVVKPSHGSVSLTNSATGAFTYTPASGYTGNDSFTFDAANSGGTSNVATESVTVNAIAAAEMLPADRLVDAAVPASAGASPTDTDVQGRLEALRDLGLRRKQAAVAREQHSRRQALANDGYLDSTANRNIAYAARVEAADSLDSESQAMARSLYGAPLLSVQRAIAAGIIKPADIAARPQNVSGTSRFTVNYIYDANENLSQVVDGANANLIYWQGTAVDAFGHITTEILGNGLVTGRTYDPNTGALQGMQSGVGTNPKIANRGYTWDADGNLHTRTDSINNLTETFGYDNLNQVKTATISGATSSTLSLHYDAVGNITSKTQPGTAADMGTYTPDTTHPYEISKITASNNAVRTFTYDNSNGNPGNGNILNDGVRSYTWNALNQATAITNIATGASTTFSYTPDRARYQEVTTNAGATNNGTLLEVSPMFEVSTIGGNTVYRNMIQAPGGVVAIHAVKSDGTLTTRYLTTDHLGSNSEVTDEVGNLSEQSSYDTFGVRRDPKTWLPYGVGASPNLSDQTDKGYTGQQMLDPLGLIHMNGRVQDPYTGRFVSADPVEGVNRYAYVYGNPSTLKDPSGYCSWCAAFTGLTGTLVTPNPANNGFDNPLSKLDKLSTNKLDIVTGLPITTPERRAMEHAAWELENNKNIQIAVAIALAVETGGASLVLLEEMGASAFWAQVGAGAVAGGVFSGTIGALNGVHGAQLVDMTLKGARSGAVAAGLLYGANAVTSYSGNNFGVGVVSHAAAGGLASKSAGGSFSKGAEFGALAYGGQLIYQHYANGNSADLAPSEGPAVYKCQGCVSDNVPTNQNWGNANYVDPTSPLLGTPVTTAACALCEGSQVTGTINQLPFMSSTSLVHDIIGDTVYGPAAVPAWFNYSTMAPAFIISVPASISSPLGAALMAADDSTKH